MYFNDTESYKLTALLSLKRFLFACKKRINTAILQTALCNRINEMTQNALATTESIVTFDIRAKTIKVVLPLGTSIVFPSNTFLSLSENADIPWNSDYGNLQYKINI